MLATLPAFPSVPQPLHDGATLEEVNATLGYLPQLRTLLLTAAQARSKALSASLVKGFRNEGEAFGDAHKTLDTLEEYRRLVDSLGFCVRKRLGNDASAIAMIDRAHIRWSHRSPDAIDIGPLFRTLGRLADQKAEAKRLAKLNSLFTQKFDSVFKLARRDGSNSLAVTSAYPPAIDHQRRAARFVVNTPAIDRDGEIIEPAGIDQSAYVHNPVVLWNHGMDTFGDVPLGKSVRSDGKPGVDISADGVTAWVEFSFHPFAEQVWQMVLRGEISAASIQVIPVKAEQRYIEGRLTPVYTASKLVEWSIVAVPSNPEAVLRSLGKRQEDKTELEEAWAQKWQNKVMKAIEGKVAAVAEGMAAKLANEMKANQEGQ